MKKQRWRRLQDKPPVGTAACERSWLTDAVKDKFRGTHSYVFLNTEDGLVFPGGNRAAADALEKDCYFELEHEHQVADADEYFQLVSTKTSQTEADKEFYAIPIGNLVKIDETGATINRTHAHCTLLFVLHHQKTPRLYRQGH